ncbi:MAG: serine--tRNA ligase [Candidatus Methylacidiphilales bacterium]
MLDIKRIRENPGEARERLSYRGADASVVDALMEMDRRRRERITQVEALKQERNATSKEIGVRKQKGQSAEDLLAGMKEHSDRITALDAECAELDREQEGLLLTLPNFPDSTVPPGRTSDDNPEVGRWGTAPVFDHPVKEHAELGEQSGWLDFAGAAKLSGSGFTVFKADGARLQRALIQFMLDLHTGEHGYVEVSPPFLVREEAMVGTGQLPKFREDMYAVEGGDLYLVPTAEVPVTNLFRETLLSEDELPLKRCAYTPCFRREAGSAGRETKGLIRMHQFDKVELVRVVRPDQSAAALESLRREAETVLERLGLHYRTIELCAGDLGFGAAKCYDIEVWAPGTGLYLEVSSCSNFSDFQARRMQLRYKDADKKNHFCHTLNGSGTALPRLIVALLETGQQPDGSVLLPPALHRHFGGDRMRPRT